MEELQFQNVLNPNYISKEKSGKQGGKSILRKKGILLTKWRGGLDSQRAFAEPFQSQPAPLDLLNMTLCWYAGVKEGWAVFKAQSGINHSQPLEISHSLLWAFNQDLTVLQAPEWTSTSEQNRKLCFRPAHCSESLFHFLQHAQQNCLF